MKTVAIVDEETLFAKSLHDKLQPADVNCEHFTRLDHFLEQLGQDEFDLVIIDLTMRDSKGVFWEFAGIEILKSLRHHCGCRPTTWMLTGHTTPYLESTCIVNGADGFLVKNLGPAAVAARIVEFFNVNVEAERMRSETDMTVEQLRA